MQTINETANITAANIPGSVSPVPPPTTLTRVERTRFVELIISNNDGRILGSFGGDNDMLASVLTRAAQMDDMASPVDKDTEVLTSLGQDFFTVTRDFVLAVRGTYYPIKTWKEILELEKSMPETARYTFVVNY